MLFVPFNTYQKHFKYISPFAKVAIEATTFLCAPAWQWFLLFLHTLKGDDITWQSSTTHLSKMCKTTYNDCMDPMPDAAYIHTYIHTRYIHTYIHTYIHRYIHTYIHTYMHTCICLPVCLVSQILMCLSELADTTSLDRWLQSMWWNTLEPV